MGIVPAVSRGSFWFALGCRDLLGLVVPYSMNVTLLSPHPTNQEQGYRPFANQHSVK